MWIPWSSKQINIVQDDELSVETVHNLRIQVMQMRLYFLPASLYLQNTIVAFWIQFQEKICCLFYSLAVTNNVTVKCVYFDINADLLSCGNI